MRTCRRAPRSEDQGRGRQLPRDTSACPGHRDPISVDYEGLGGARPDTPEVMQRAKEIRPASGIRRCSWARGRPARLTKGSGTGSRPTWSCSRSAVDPPDVSLGPGSDPEPRARGGLSATSMRSSGQTVGASTVSSADIGLEAVHYLQPLLPSRRDGGMFGAADVMPVTPLRDGMNLVAKEYVACLHDGGGALKLVSSPGPARLHQAFACNPHDIAGLKQTMLSAMTPTRQSSGSCEPSGAGSPPTTPPAGQAASSRAPRGRCQGPARLPRADRARRRHAPEISAPRSRGSPVPLTDPSRPGAGPPDGSADPLDEARAVCPGPESLLMASDFDGVLPVRRRPDGLGPPDGTRVLRALADFAAHPHGRVRSDLERSALTASARRAA